MQLLPIALMIALALLSGCASAIKQNDINATKEAGIALLAEGRAEQANVRFNRALASKPTDAHLHFLNALSYRQQAQSGQTVTELEETGYRLALEFDPDHWLAAWHLGLLQLDQRQWSEARQTLAKAARLRPRNADIQLALAGTAYLAGDAPVALVAARNTLTLRQNDPEALRIAALSGAALGMETEADNYYRVFRETRPAEAETLGDRILDWKQIYAVASATDLSSPAPSAPAENPASTQPAASSGTGQGPRLPAWSDCVQSTSGQSATLSTLSTDTTERLPALPAPCKGLPLPRMVVVDATIIRTLDSTEYKQGVNLLDGLKVVLGGGWESTRTTNSQGVSTRSTSITRSLGLPQGGISYSLNIFNAEDTRADVIARPSLLALDRMPSTFFSGATVSVALEGQYGGAISDKNIGVSLSITPTFIDDENLLLAVKGARSFIEPAQFDGFDQAITSSNNIVFASVIMRFGETLILSGLREREYIKAKSGVPLLRDIPLLQYLFSSNSDFDYAHNVMILVTPRKPANFSETDRAAQAYLRSPEFQKIPKDAISQAAIEVLRPRRPNMEAILAKLQRSPYLNEFRTGDLSGRRFAPSPSLERVLQDIKQMAYY